MRYKILSDMRECMDELITRYEHGEDVLDQIHLCDEIIRMNERN